MADSQVVMGKAGCRTWVSFSQLSQRMCPSTGLAFWTLGFFLSLKGCIISSFLSRHKIFLLTQVTLQYQSSYLSTRITAILSWGSEINYPEILSLLNKEKKNTFSLSLCCCMQQQVGKKSGGTSSLPIMIYQYQISITLFDSRVFSLFLSLHHSSVNSSYCIC